jgi:hypothetical protein
MCLLIYQSYKYTVLQTLILHINKVTTKVNFIINNNINKSMDKMCGNDCSNCEDYCFQGADHTLPKIREQPFVSFAVSNIMAKVEGNVVPVRAIKAYGPHSFTSS